MTSKTWIVLGTAIGWTLLLVVLFNHRSSNGNNLTIRDFKRILKESKGIDHQPQTESYSKGKRKGHMLIEENPIPDQDELEKMSTADLEILFHRSANSPQATCSSVERMGNVGDGGWEVCLDPRYAPDPEDCLVYSFGINYKFSFDDAIADYGCEVHSFDPSMWRTKDHLRGERVHFHLEGLGEVDGMVKVAKFNATWPLYTMASIRRRLRHAQGKRRIDMLKMDIEGFERDALPQAFRDGSLSDIPQVAFELHGGHRRPLYLKNLQVLRDAFDYGLRIYHTNRNLGCRSESQYTHKFRSNCLEIYTLNVSLAR